MPIVTPDLVYQSKFTASLQGEQYVRRFVVTEINAVDTAAAMYQACVAVAQQYAPYGSPHPTIPNIYVSNYQGDPFDKSSRTQAYVLVTYSTPNLSNNVNIKVSSTTQNEPYGKDPKTGKPIFVTYQGQPATVKINVPIPKSTVEYTQIEAQCPLGKATLFVGTCNSDSFQGGAPLTWMCRSINGDWLGPPTLTSPGGFRVTYVFENAGPGNDFTQLYLWVDTGPTHIPATDATINPLPFSGDGGNGLYRYVPPQKAFSALNIPNLTS